MPDGGGEVRRLRIHRRALTFAVVAISLICLGVLGIGARGLSLETQLREMPALRAENVALRSEIERIDDRLRAVSKVVDRVQQLDARVRRIIMIGDSDTGGPVGG